MNGSNPYVAAREQAEAAAANAQDLNRLWWERLPMTYAAWAAGDRIDRGDDAAAASIATFVATNPWLAQNFDFAAFAGKDVLEIGCGAGAASCLFARGGARVTAIDLTEQGVALTRRAAEQLSLKVDARRMDAEQLEFPDRSFDLVFTWGVIHHSQHTEAIAREIARVLRPGGRALCMVYNRASLRYYVKGLAWLVLRGKALQGFGFAGVQRFFTDGYYHRHFSKGEFAALFAEAGLRLDRMSVTHMAKHMVPLVPRRIDDGLKHRYGWLLVGEFSKPAAAEAHLGGHSE